MSAIFIPCAPQSYGDTTMCRSCGLTWDTGDPDPPECLYKKRIKGLEGEVRTLKLLASINYGAIGWITFILAISDVIPMNLMSASFVALGWGLCFWFAIKAWKLDD